jgi:hypothetical protein
VACASIIPSASNKKSKNTLKSDPASEPVTNKKKTKGFKPIVEKIKLQSQLQPAVLLLQQKVLNTLKHAQSQLIRGGEIVNEAHEKSMIRRQSIAELTEKLKSSRSKEDEVSLDKLAMQEALSAENMIGEALVTICRRFYILRYWYFADAADDGHPEDPILGFRDENLERMLAVALDAADLPSSSFDAHDKADRILFKISVLIREDKWLIEKGLLGQADTVLDDWSSLLDEPEVEQQKGPEAPVENDDKKPQLTLRSNMNTAQSGWVNCVWAMNYFRR